MCISTKVIVKPSKSKIPRDYVETHSYFVEKIKRLIELIFQTMEDEKGEILT